MPFHLGWGLGLFLNAADDPVVSQGPNNTVVGRPVDSAGTADRVASGINYESTFGAQVILIGGATVEKSQCMQDAINLAGTRGALVVAGTGNDGMNLTAKPSVPLV